MRYSHFGGTFNISGCTWFSIFRFKSTQQAIVANKYRNSLTQGLCENIRIISRVCGADVRSD
jgi:hypothetical protein